MSCITTDTVTVWSVSVFRDNRIIVEDNIEFIDEETAIERARLYVSKYVEETGIHHHAEIKMKILPVYMW